LSHKSKDQLGQTLGLLDSYCTFRSCSPNLTCTLHIRWCLYSTILHRLVFLTLRLKFLEEFQNVYPLPLKLENHQWSEFHLFVAKSLVVRFLKEEARNLPLDCKCLSMFQRFLQQRSEYMPPYLQSQWLSNLWIHRCRLRLTSTTHHWQKWSISKLQVKRILLLLLQR